MKYFLFIFTALVFLGGIWLFRQAMRPAEEQEAVPTAIINDHVLGLEVARTPEEQSRGLSERESLAADAGMVFLYGEPSLPGFWMSDMNFAIDIIWVDANKKIVAITPVVLPETYPEIFHPPSPVQYVLEVNAGWAESHNISVGETVALYDVF